MNAAADARARPPLETRDGEHARDHGMPRSTTLGTRGVIIQCAQDRAASSRLDHLCGAGRDDRSGGDRGSPEQARPDEPRRTGRVVLRASTSAVRRPVAQPHRGPLESAPMDVPDRRRGSWRHRGCSACVSRLPRHSRVAEPRERWAGAYSGAVERACGRTGVRVHARPPFTPVNSRVGVDLPADRGIASLSVVARIEGGW